jgi:hypothetical protein
MTSGLLTFPAKEGCLGPLVVSRCAVPARACVHDNNNNDNNNDNDNENDNNNNNTNNTNNTNNNNNNNSRPLHPAGVTSTIASCQGEHHALQQLTAAS